MSKYSKQIAETATVELEMWQWKQILGKVRHEKHTARSTEARKDSEQIELAIKHQLEAQENE